MLENTTFILVKWRNAEVGLVPGQVKSKAFLILGFAVSTLSIWLKGFLKRAKKWSVSGQ